MPQQFTSIQVSGDPFNGGPLTAGIIETVIILDNDSLLQPNTQDTGDQFSIGGVNFTSSAYPTFGTNSGVEIYSATVNGLPVTFGYLTAAADGVDDAVDRLVVLTGTISPGDVISNINLTSTNTSLPYTNIPSIVCFTPGTVISTPTGPRVIETLQVGDLVITADNGLQAIRWIGTKHVSGARLMAHPHLRPIRIKAHAFGYNRPVHDLLVSPQHRMFLKSRQAQLMFGETEILMTAKSLTNDKTIMLDQKATEVDYIHILFDRHELVQANGSWSESFHPGAVGLDAIEGNAKVELFEIFPELQNDPNSYGPSARQSVNEREAKILLRAY
jgi:hypothetical protein